MDRGADPFLVDHKGETPFVTRQKSLKVSKLTYLLSGHNENVEITRLLREVTVGPVELPTAGQLETMLRAEIPELQFLF